MSNDDNRSDDVIFFPPLLNVRNQSAADHQGSTAAGQRNWTFPPSLGRSNIGQERTSTWADIYITPVLLKHFLCGGQA
jgi:hypothetical protein